MDSCARCALRAGEASLRSSDIASRPTPPRAMASSRRFFWAAKKSHRPLGLDRVGPQPSWNFLGQKVSNRTGGEPPMQLNDRMMPAARQGFALLLLALAVVTPAAGQGTDLEKALQAAAAGDTQAQRMLGEMYRDGRGVKKDDGAAVQWFRRAAQGGDATAQFNLGLLYRDGRGVPP